MTWKEFKEEAERLGLEDSDKLDWIQFSAAAPMGIKDSGEGGTAIINVLAT